MYWTKCIFAKIDILFLINIYQYILSVLIIRLKVSFFKTSSCIKYRLGSIGPSNHGLQSHLKETFSFSFLHIAFITLTNCTIYVWKVELKFQIFQQSTRETLYRQLYRDIEICKSTKEKKFAFGKLLPRDIRINAPTENIAEKWLHGVKVPSELEDMSAVWEGITNLRSLIITLLNIQNNLFFF